MYYYGERQKHILGGIIMNFKKIVATSVLLGAFITGNALAASSTTSISSNQSSAEGANINISAGVDTYLYGTNASTSTNSVYIQKMKDVTGPDSNVAEFKIGVGNKGTGQWYTTGSSGNYYVKMNPEGALSKGVNGTASLSY